MSLAWLFPLGLAGLAALLVPLLLHLARRREQRVLRFAAMRWLPAGRAPRRRLRLQERRLLALRLLLLAIAALWLAQPLLQDVGTPQRWLAVAPSVDPTAARSIAGDYERAVWLAPGLPPLARPLPEDAVTWPSVLQEFAARLPAEDTGAVLVPDVVTGLGKQLPTLWHDLDWREAAAAPSADAEPSPRLLALRYSAADSAVLPWLRAAIAAWDKDPQLRVQLDDAPASTPVPSGASAVLWLGPLPNATRRPAIPLIHIPTFELHPSPAARAGGGEGPPPPSAPTEPRTQATTEPDAQADPARGAPPTARESDRPAQPAPNAPLPTRPLDARPTDWRTLAQPLHPSTLPVLYEPDFPRRLHATLFGPTPPRRVPATRLHELPVAAPAGRQGDAALSLRGLRDLALSPLLAWLLLALFLLERWFATGRRLGRAP